MTHERRLLLDLWLAQVGAHKLWGTRAVQNCLLEAWEIGGQIVLVQDHGVEGWDLFVPPHAGNSQCDTLNTAATMLNVPDCRPIVGKESPT